MQRWRRHILPPGLLLAILFAPLTVSAYGFIAPGQVPLRGSLPNGIDLMESGLYWLQDMTSAYAVRDPASLIHLMEEQAARFFDFSWMAYEVAGPDYTRMDVLQRSHFQNRVRDRLFEQLARKTGMYDARMPRFAPLPPAPVGAYSWKVGGDIIRPAGPVTRLVFYFYLTPRGWRIFDVSSNGISAVAEMRKAYFNKRFRP